MAADYDFRRKPNEKGDGEVQPLYPRIVSKGTIDSKRLFREIAEASSFTEGDLAGIMVAFQEKVSYYLSEGYHVKLGEIGYFSSSLKARPVMDKKEYSQITGLLKGKAQRELNLLVENGVLNTRGYGNRIVYLKSDNQDIK